jgi:hypothetical protein
MDTNRGIEYGHVKHRSTLRRTRAATQGSLPANPGTADARTRRVRPGNG